MAADKKTLLRDALKQVQAGKIDKAVETYRAIVKLDPRDAAVHNSLADLLGRQGKKKDAIAEYLEASALYEKDGFGPRAIAMCQKIVKLDGEQWGVRLKLGDLYAAQKLQAEARAIYLQLAERHDKRGEVAPALEIFRRIADLDPGNVPVRVKLAGMFEKQKQPDQAAAEYVRAAKAHAARKENDAAIELLARAFKLSPGNIEARRLLADFSAQRQEWQVVVGLLETPVARGSQDTGLVVLYAEALTQVNHAREAAELLEKLQASEPNAMPVNLALGRAYLKAGDVEKGAAALNRCIGAHLAENRLELAESLLQELTAAAPEDDRVLQQIVEVAHKRGDPEGAARAYLRLAAVYEKKGLLRTAVGALERYLEGRPGDKAVMERLERLRAAAPHPTPVSPKPVIEVKTAAPPVPAAAPPVAPAAAPPDREEEITIDLEEGEDLSLLMVEGEEEEELEVEGEDELVAAGEEEFVVEGAEEIPEVVAEPAGVAATPDIAAAPAEEELIEIRLEDEGPQEPLPAPEEPPEACGVVSLEEAAPPLESPAAPAGEYGEISLPETPAPAEAYDEMSAAEMPAGPEAGEPSFEEERAALESGLEPAAPEEPALESFDSAFVAVDAAEAPPAGATVPHEGGAGEADASQAFQAEADFYVQQGLLDEAESIYRRLEELSPGSPVVAAQLSRLRELRAAAPQPPSAEALTRPESSGSGEAAPAASPRGAGAEFEDYLGDLRQELESQGELVPPPPLEEAGLHEIFQEFQRSVREQLGDEDFETHYNLGIAYKEMGLTEEAVGEFSLAEKSPTRRLDAVSMIALCMREQGRLDEAAQKLRTGIALAVEGSEQQKGFLYDLAALHEQSARADLAREALERLHAMDPAYRDVAARLGSGEPPAGSPRRKSKISYL